MKTPICDFVKKYAQDKALRLHMPGHKGKPFIGAEHLDITEIAGADSLYEASGIIAESEKNASELFGCLIRAIGMAGAALATAISHGIQLTLHHLYCRWLGQGSYPFPMGVWAKYAVGFLAIMGFVYVSENLWFLRWGVGAALGIFELLRIKKRKVLI